jgi:F-type H+-transporting ATPase subunit b
MRARKLLLALALVGVVVMANAGIAAAAEEKKLSFSSEECIKNVEEKDDPEACNKAPKPILPATNEIVWGAISFVLLFGLLGKFAYPAIKKSMEERTEKIRNSLDDAERAKVDAEGVLAEYNRQLADARAESARIIEEARVQAEQVRRDLIAKAEADATELRQRTAEQATAERERVMGELRSQVSELAIELAEKVVESNLDREANKRLIENYINSVGSR